MIKPMSPASDDTIDLRSRIMFTLLGALSLAGEDVVRLRGPR